MQVRLQLLHRPDNMTAAHRAEQSAIFDGDAWEAEVLWQAARVLKEDFGRSEDDVRDALQAVTGRLSDLYEE